jgi:hypothetical protein
VEEELAWDGREGPVLACWRDSTNRPLLPCVALPCRSAVRSSCATTILLGRGADESLREVVGSIMLRRLLSIPSFMWVFSPFPLITNSFFLSIREPRLFFPSLLSIPFLSVSLYFHKMFSN